MDRRADVNPTVYYDSNIFRLIPDSSDPFPTSGLCMCVYWVVSSSVGRCCEELRSSVSKSVSRSVSRSSVFIFRSQQGVLDWESSNPCEALIFGLGSLIPDVDCFPDNINWEGVKVLEKDNKSDTRKSHFARWNDQVLKQHCKDV